MQRETTYRLARSAALAGPCGFVGAAFVHSFGQAAAKELLPFAPLAGCLALLSWAALFYRPTERFLAALPYAAAAVILRGLVVVASRPEVSARLAAQSRLNAPLLFAATPTGCVIFAALAVGADWLRRSRLRYDPTTNRHVLHAETIVFFLLTVWLHLLDAEYGIYG